MENKTCGECRWFDEETNLCMAYEDHFSEAYADTVACDDFETPQESAGDLEIQKLKDALLDISKIGFEGKISDKAARETMRRIANSVLAEKGGEDELS